MTQPTTNLPAAVDLLSPDLLLTPPTVAELDGYRTEIVRVGLRLHDFVGLLLYWELRLRPDGYAHSESWAGSSFDVSRSTVTRWRTIAQKKYHLDPPTPLSAGQQRAGKAVSARNAKPQVEGKAAKTRSTPDQAKRENGRGAPIEATAHLVSPTVETPTNLAVAPATNGKAKPTGTLIYTVTVPAGDGPLFEALLESQHRAWTYASAQRLPVSAATHPSNGHGSGTREVSPRLKGMGR